MSLFHCFVCSYLNQASLTFVDTCLGWGDQYEEDEDGWVLFVLTSFFTDNVLYWRIYSDTALVCTSVFPFSDAFIESVRIGNPD